MRFHPRQQVLIAAPCPRQIKVLLVTTFAVVIGQIVYWYTWPFSLNVLENKSSPSLATRPFEFFNTTLSPTQKPTPSPTLDPSSSPTQKQTPPPATGPTSSPIQQQSTELSEFEFYVKVHNSTFPVKQAGEWVYKPGIQAIHPSKEHLMCLDRERQGNCHDADAWTKSNDTAKQSRHNSVIANAIINSPGILAANDPWVWESNVPQYQVLSYHSGPELYKKQVHKAVRGRKLYLVGDSLTRQWSQAMRCELQHVLGYTEEEANDTVQYLQVHTGVDQMRNTWFEHASERDYIVFNFGHHVGKKLGSDWPELYRQILRKVLTFPFGKVPDSNLFFRTTTVRHFHKGAGDWDTKSSRSGNVEPNMDGQWSHYGGSRPEQPIQNLIAFEMFLGPNLKKSDHKFQILDTSPLMLARGDATFDGSHICLPGPMEYWSRMLYHRILQANKA